MMVSFTEIVSSCLRAIFLDYRDRGMRVFFSLSIFREKETERSESGGSEKSQRSQRKWLKRLFLLREMRKVVVGEKQRRQ